VHLVADGTALRVGWIGEMCPEKTVALTVARDTTRLVVLVDEGIRVCTNSMGTRRAVDLEFRAGVDLTNVVGELIVAQLPSGVE
jgi:hypothetical protein